MLYRSDGTSFVIGVTTFYDTNPINPGRQNSIYLRAVLSREMGVSVHAMVDSGAPYCLFDSDIGGMLGWDYSSGEPAELSTRVGRFTGTIQRLPIIIAAEEGESLQIEAIDTQWAGLKHYASVRRQGERNGQSFDATTYYITSESMSAWCSSP
jgi:hypothetical protein